MNNGLLQDSNFSILIKYLEDETSLELQDVVKSLQSFKNSLTYSFFNNLSKTENLVDLLNDIWNILYKLAAKSDATLKISVFNTFGSLLFSLGPFYPIELIKSFIQSIQTIPPEKGVSISIIACYCQITRFISLINIQEFYSNLPIIEHFCAEYIKDDLKFLPGLFAMLKEPINHEFNYVMFRTLIKNFRNENVSSYLIKSLFELIKKSPLILESDDQILIDPLNSKIALYLYPFILQDTELVTNHLKEENLYKIENLAMSFLMNKETSFSDFEQSSTILVYLQIYTDQRENLTKLREIYQDSLPQQLEIFSYKLFFQDKIEQLLPNQDKDSLTIITNKIDAISFHMLSLKDESIFQKCLETFLYYSKTNGEIFSHITEGLTFIFKNIVKKENEQITSFFHNETIKNIFQAILEEIFHKKNLNWVQQMSICKLLCVIPRKYGNIIYHNFSNERVKLILPFTISKQKNLARESKIELCKIISARECQLVIDFIIHSDLLDSNVFCSFIELINMLCKIFSYSLFAQLKPLLSEAFLLMSSISATSQFFKYLNHINKIEARNSSNQNLEDVNEKYLFERSLDLLVKLYKAYTGLEISIQSSIDSYDLPKLTTIIETDITTTNLHSSYYLKCMKQCYIYCSRFKNLNTTANLLPISNILISVFPIQVFSFLKEQIIQDNKQLNKENFIGKINDILISTNSIKIAARACDMCAFLGLNQTEEKREHYQEIKENIMKFLNLEINDGCNLCYFYNFCGNEIITKVAALNDKNKCLFNFLSNSSLTGVKIDNSGLVTAQSFKFIDWPLHNHKFMNFVTENIKELLPYIEQQYKKHLQDLKLYNQQLKNKQRKSPKVIKTSKQNENQKLQEESKQISPKTDKTEIIPQTNHSEAKEEEKIELQKENEKTLSNELEEKIENDKENVEQSNKDEKPQEKDQKEVSHSKNRTILKDKPKLNTCFNINEMDIYQKRYLGENSNLFTFLSKEDLEKVERFSYSKPKLVIIKEKTSQYSSITPPLVFHEILQDVNLLKNFCSYSTLHLEKKTFISLCEVLIDNNLFDSMFLLAKNQNKRIPEKLIEKIIPKIENDDELLVNSAVYYTNSPKKSQSIKDMFHKISQKIQNPVLEIRHNKKAYALVVIATRPSFETFIRTFIPEKKYVKSLLYFVNEFGHFPDKEVDLINYCLSVTYDDPVNLLWILRYIRSFVSFNLSISNLKDFEDKLIPLKHTLQLLEIRGIVSYVACPNFIKQIGNEKYLNNLFIEGQTLCQTVKTENINNCTQSQIPSLLCSSMRCFKSFMTPFYYNTFYYTYWNVVLQVKETKNIIILDEFSRLLCFIESSDEKPKQYEQYMKPAALEMYKKFKYSGEKELFETLFQENLQNTDKNTSNSAQNQQDVIQNKSVMSICNHYFLGEDSIPMTFDIATETLKEMGNMGAAYFIIGQTDSLKAHFFELYATLAKIMRRMTREELSAFTTISKTQIIPKLKSKEKAQAFSLLFTGKRKSRMEGAEIAQMIDANMS